MNKYLLKSLLFLWLSFYVSRVSGQCDAGFTFTSKVCTGSDVQFKANDSSGGKNYLWDFGDPFSGILNEDTLRNTSHYYKDSGNYTITLIVWDTACSDTQQFQLTVVKKPRALFSVNDHCAGLNSTFTNLSTAGVSDSIIQYQWDLDNSVSSGLKNPVNKYNSTGVVQIRLIVNTLTGCMDTAVRSLTIYKKPSGSRNPASICRNEQVDFSADTIYNATQYSWNFGDSSGFSQRTVAHVYNKAGTFFPKLTTHFGTATCTVSIDSVIVFPLPDASFTIAKDTYCFNYNDVCIRLNSPKANYVSRTVIFDDGFVYDNPPFSDSLICHHYSDTAGGTYSISVEIIDSNQCISVSTKNDAIVIHPELEASFSYTAGNGCFKTPVNLTNTSNQQPPGIKSFEWDFGDGSKNDSIWTGLGYTYTDDGSFLIRLMLENIEGCRDTFISGKAVNNTNFVVDAKIDSAKGICHNNNLTFFSQTSIPGATIEWNFRPGGISNSFSTLHAYNAPGVYKPWVTISKNGCDSTAFLDSVVIHGPVAVFGNIVNRFQCQAKDTVYFQNNSVLFRNSNPAVFWDAGDFNATTCIINSGKGQNVTQNCRYSEDALKFRHLYSKGVDTCYYAKLRVIDTTIGCADSAYAAIPLMRPLAKGRFSPNTLTPCPGPESSKFVSFNINLPNPQCLKYSWWVMWDSLKARENGNFDSFWLYNSTGFNYSYSDYAGDSDGFVSIGLVVENGRDTNGNLCRDTGWFHKILKVTRVSPRFSSSYNSTQHYCPGSTLLFFPKDSIQATASNFRWDFGDGTIKNTASRGYQAHTYRRSGNYRVRLTVTDSNGCTVDSSMGVDIGFRIDFDITAGLKCAGDSFRLNENIRYFNNGIDNIAYWSDSSRSGKEKLFWNLGDGNGYRNLGPNPVLRLSTPGIYQISMAAEDSTGCLDTLLNHKTIQISGIYAGFTIPADTILCAQTLKFNSTATVTDSVAGKTLPGDRVSTWEYNFGAQYPISSLPSPARYFATGIYDIRQVVMNNNGCRDTLNRQIVVTGPQARFSIVSDTIGCSPLRIEFKNESNIASSWTWDFQDISNSAFSTNADTNITFYYRGYGIFTPRLIARGSFTINGVTRVCNDVFPDTSLGLLKRVVVWEQPVPGFNWNTNCKTGTTLFTSTSSMKTGRIVATRWNFGDGNTDTGLSVSHNYIDTGTYRIVLHVISEKGCEDSLVRNIVISPQPIAWFGFNRDCQGVATQFRDSSIAYNDRIYRWLWNFGDGTTSNIQNPVKLFTKDTTFQVSLTITNIAGCAETVTRQVLIYSKPIPAFSFDNVCDKNPVFFNSLSSSKQTIAEYIWKRGDGSKSANTNDTHTYATHGTYPAKLVLKTIHNCRDSITRTVVIYPNPVAIISIPRNEQCLKGNNFRFEDSSRIFSGSTSAFWRLGDGNNNNSKFFNHQYSSHGTFNIRLLSTSGFGCRDSTTADINVYPNPSSLFGINRAVQCIRYNRFLFTDSGSIATGNYTAEWQFGDGNTAAGGSVYHTYADTGKFSVLQILTSDLGCKDSSRAIMRLNPMPVAAFVINDSGQCLRQNNYIFTNGSTVASGRTLTYKWKFGNGDSSSGVNPVYVYPAHGLFDVLLSVRSTDGCIDTAVKQVDVHPMPVSAFVINDSARCLAQNNFIFTNNSSIPYGIMNHRWRFGDGNSSLQTNPNHVYSTYGNYIVVLVSQSQNGCTDSFKRSLVVHPMPVVRPRVNNSGQCINGQLFVFSDSSSVASGSLNRQWQLGDSTQSTAATLNKTYLYPGIKNVKLLQNSDKGCRDSATIQVDVYFKPYPRISVNDSDQCLRNNVFAFSNISTIQTGILSHLWNFGDTNYSAATNPTHTYSSHRTFNVTLRVTSDKSCTDSVILPVTVFPMPFTRFLVNDSEQCLRQNNFVFQNQSGIAYGSMSYRWQFGDGQSSVLAGPAHIYTNFGSFNVKLVSASDRGCLDSISRKTVVNPMPQVVFSVNDSAQCINAQNFVFTDNSSIAGGSLNRRWKFSDSFGTVNPLNRSFSSDTNHIITLIQTSDRGCMDSAFRMITVHSAPLVQFSVNDTDQCVRQNLFRFTNLSGIRKGQLSWNWNFGDGNNSDTLNPENKYALYGNYQTTLRATSEKGCTDTLSRWMRVDPMPEPGFTINDTGQCINNQLFAFTNQSRIAAGSITPFWKFGDNTVSNAGNPQKTYAYDTVYSVWLIETSNKGCMDSIRKQVDVYPKPIMQFAINDTVQCLRQNNFVFSNQSSIKYGSLSHTWQSGDGNTGATVDFQHIYSSHGVYNVLLRSVSDLNCTDSLIKPVIVGAMPVPGFSINNAGQCLRNQNFVFTGSGNIARGNFSTLWRTGDSDTIQTADATHTYTAIGKFSVNQILTSDFGCMDSMQKDIRVHPNADVSFLTNDSDQCENQQNFVFRNTSNIAAGSIRNISWNLGNGTFSNQNIVNAYYPNSGFYRISLTAISDSGCIDSVISTVRVYPKPATWFVVNDSAQCLFQNDYLFTDNSTDSFGVNQYRWDINSQSFQNTKTAAFRFTTPGFKNITLISTSLRGCSDTASRVVYVKPMPDPGFEKLRTFYCELTGPYNFIANTPGGNFSGFNVSNNSYIPVRLWKDTIKYTVTVNGCTDSSRQFTQVYPGPRVQLPRDSTLCKYEILELMVNSWQSSFIWDNGSTLPARRIVKPGQYSVTVTNICGVKRDTVNVQYRDINCRFFLPTAFTPNRDGLNDRYKPVTYNVDEMTFMIYNRWGQKIYEGNISDPGWDGTYMGQEVPSGSYVIYVSYKYNLGYRFITETAETAFELMR
jgi:gliding motility-associated-like protein